VPPDTVLPTGPHARHVRERLIAVGVLGILAVFLSAPITIHTGVVEHARDVAAAGHHRLHSLAAHARYDAVHVGGGSVSFSIMIVAELLGTLVAIALMLSWAEHRRADTWTPDPDRSDARRGTNP
jgi:hypothetical protein